MYIVIAIVATVCTIVAAEIRGTGIPQIRTNGIVLVLLVVATLCVVPMFVILVRSISTETVTGDEWHGDKWQLVSHLLAIVTLYVLVSVWYLRSVRPSRLAG